jgi:hypothetical protein
MPSLEVQAGQAPQPWAAWTFSATAILEVYDALLPNHRCHPVIVVDFSISSLTECVG